MTINLQAIVDPSRTKSKRWGSPTLIIAVLVIVFFVLSALLGPWLFAQQAGTVNPAIGRQGPSAAHLLGTDQLGRDILARTLVGARASLGYAFGATALTALIGVGLGLLAAALGNRARQVMFQLSATATAFPAILLAVILATLFGRSGTAAMLGLAIAAVPTTARITMTLAVGAAGTDQVAAARVVGVGTLRILLRYVLPQISQPLATFTILAAASNLVALSALSFVGLGVQPPEWDWGAMLNSALKEIYTSPFGVVGPGIAIVLAGVVLNIVGEHLARLLDPRNRVRRAGSVASTASARPVTDPLSQEALRPVDIADPVLRVQDLRVATNTEPHHELVHGVDITVGRGQRVGIVGESGSGKSLTLSAMAHLMPPGLGSTAAHHQFNGTELADKDARTRRRVLGDQVALVFQDPMSSLNPSLTIGSILSDKLKAHTNLSRSEVRRRVVAALDEVSIPDPTRTIDRFPHQLSGGQRQRVMVALALLGRTELLLADEPTTALDVSVQRQIANLLVRVNEERGISVVLVSHDIALVSEICDRIIVMRNGWVVEQGTTEEVLTDPQHPYTRALLAALPQSLTAVSSGQAAGKQTGSLA